jgi:hypothetical protein
VKDVLVIFDPTPLSTQTVEDAMGSFDVQVQSCTISDSLYAFRTLEVLSCKI